MSQQQDNNELQSALIAIAAILGVTAIIVTFILSMMSGGVGSNQVSASGSDPAAIEARIRPVVTLEDIRGGSEPAMEAAPAAAKSAKELYAAACSACHDNGVAGAPKPGDKAGWQARLDTGMETMLASVVNGKGAMPPKGGSAYSDEEITQIIEYILVETGLMTAKAEAPAEAKVEEAAPAAMMKEEPMVKTSDVDLAAGEKSYRSACFACHDHGIAGAPKLGDTAGWAGRTDLDALTKSAIEGKGGMPPKGGAAYLSDEEVRNIVGFMLSKN